MIDRTMRYVCYATPARSDGTLLDVAEVLRAHWFDVTLRDGTIFAPGSVACSLFGPAKRRRSRLAGNENRLHRTRDQS